MSRERVPRRVWMAGVVLSLMAAAQPAAASAAELTAGTVAAWDTYIRRLELRRSREFGHTDRFLSLDFDDAAGSIRRALLRGDVVIDDRAAGVSGGLVPVPGGAIHHWRAAVLVRGITLPDLLSALRNPRQHGYTPEDVLVWRLLERSGDRERVFLRIRREEIVTAVFDTVHDVEFARHGPGRASSRSVATRISELDDGGADGVHEKPAGRDRGFLWRLNAYWRYQAVEGGVLVELESVTLSRDVPLLLAPVARPVIRRVARGAIERTLLGLRNQLGKPRQVF